MLEALATCIEELSVCARLRIVLLDDLDLHVPGVPERDREVRAGRRLAAVPEVRRDDVAQDEERTDPEDLRPFGQRRVQVVYHERDLANLSVQPAHCAPIVLFGDAEVTSSAPMRSCRDEQRTAEVRL
ncbi:MAG TPA: hypothetical protein VF152_00795, partial [Acidimicrobiia bacterium]